MNKISIIIFPLLLGACSLLSGEDELPQAATVSVCPHTYSWTTQQIKTLGKEDEGLPAGSMAHRAIAEDHDIRAQINSACGDGNGKRP